MANNTNLSYPLYYNQQFFDKNGNPLSNGKLYTYEAGTSTSIVTYKTIGEESSANMNTNPIILDSSGYAKLVVKKGLYYRFVLKDKNDSFVNEWDNVSSVDISSGSLSSIRIRGKDNEIDVEESESGGVKTFLIKLASHIKNVINGKKDKQEPLVFNGSAVKTIKKLIQNENGNVDVEFENIELPEPSWGVFKSAVLHTDTTAQHLHLTLDAYSGDSISLQSNAIKLGVGDYLVCGTLEIQGPTTPSPDYERITFGIFNSESSYDVDCSETAKKVIPFCTIVNNVTQNYSDMFDVQCTKAGVSVTLTSLTITAIVTSTSNSESGISIVTHDNTLNGAGTLMSPLGVNTAALINENLPSSTKFPTETAVVNFVNNAVSTYSAKFLGTLSLTNDLNLPYTSSNATIVAALNSYQFEDTPSVNDFCFVEIDDPQTTGPDEYRRFSFDGSVWKYQYTINSTAFTPTQWAAINSGVTSQKVSDYDSHLVNQSNPHNVTKEQVGLGNVTNDAQVKRSEMGAANGVPTLDNTTKIPLSQLPIAIDPNNGDTSKFLNERGNFTSVPVVNSFTYEGASSYPNSAPSVPAVVDYVQKSEFVILPESGKKFFTIAKLKKTDFPERASLKITLAPAATDADTGFAEPQSADIDITCMAQGDSASYDKYDVTIRWYYPGTALYTWNSYPTDGMKEIYLIESGNYIYVVLETAIDTLDLYTTKILCHTDNRAFVFVGTQGATIPSGTIKDSAEMLPVVTREPIVFETTGVIYNYFTLCDLNTFKEAIHSGRPVIIKENVSSTQCDMYYLEYASSIEGIFYHRQLNRTYDEHDVVQSYKVLLRIIEIDIDYVNNRLPVHRRAEFLLGENNVVPIANIPTTGSVTNGDTTHVPTADAVYQGLSSKADKVSGSVAGLLASLDSHGNLVSSGIPARDVSETINVIGGKQDLLPTSGAATETYAINVTGMAAELNVTGRADDTNANTLGTAGRMTIDVIRCTNTTAANLPITGYNVVETALFSVAGFGFQRSTAWGYNRVWVRCLSNSWTTWKEL